MRKAYLTRCGYPPKEDFILLLILAIKQPPPYDYLLLVFACVLSIISYS